jgi:hypothetical protein
MASIKARILSPLPEYLDESISDTLAPRPGSLDGKILGLFPNWRPSAVHILKALGDLVARRYRLESVVMEQPLLENPPSEKGRLLDVMKDHLDAFAGRVDVAITATGD